jgi:hypothetical protein
VPESVSPCCVHANKNRAQAGAVAGLAHHPWSRLAANPVIGHGLQMQYWYQPRSPGVPHCCCCCGCPCVSCVLCRRSLTTTAPGWVCHTCCCRC